MPDDTDKLRVDSKKEAVQSAISQCISQIHDERPGIDNDQAVAICNEKARRLTGHGAHRAE